MVVLPYEEIEDRESLSHDHGDDDFRGDTCALRETDKMINAYISSQDVPPAAGSR